MGIYWIISLYVREILFCENEIFIMLQVHFKLMKMGIPTVTQSKVCVI